MKSYYYTPLSDYPTCTECETSYMSYQILENGLCPDCRCPECGDAIKPLTRDAVKCVDPHCGAISIRDPKSDELELVIDSSGNILINQPITQQQATR